MPVRREPLYYNPSTGRHQTFRTQQWLDVFLPGAAPVAHATSHQVGGSDPISVAGLSGQLADPQPMLVRKNSTGPGFQRTRVNLIEGTGLLLTVVDDPTNGEVDVTIAASLNNGASTVDFGGIPGATSAQVNVTTPIGVASVALAWFMYEASADHTADEHALAALLVGLSAFRSGANTLTIKARASTPLTGRYTVRWRWE